MSQQPDERKTSDTVTAPYAQSTPATPEAERETIIVIPGDRSEVSVWTNIPKHIRAFRKRAAPSTNPPTTNPTPPTTDNPPVTTPVPKVRELRSGFHGTTEWADFRIAERDYNPAQGVKRNSNLSPEQRAAAAERLRANKKRAASPAGSL